MAAIAGIQAAARSEREAVLSEANTQATALYTEFDGLRSRSEQKTAALGLRASSAAAKQRAAIGARAAGASASVTADVGATAQAVQQAGSDASASLEEADGREAERVWGETEAQAAGIDRRGQGARSSYGGDEGG